jgi:hypothetical protein
LQMWKDLYIVRSARIGSISPPLPHDKLKTRLKETIHKAFSHRNDGSKFVVQTFEETPTHMSKKINRLEEGCNSYPMVCRRPAEIVSLQRRQICYRWGTFISIIDRNDRIWFSMFCLKHRTVKCWCEVSIDVDWCTNHVPKFRSFCITQSWESP